MPESAQQILHELTSAGLLSSDQVTQYDQEIKTGVDALLDRLVAESVITQYQADKFRDGKGADIHFGDYLVTDKLGQGGMGTVLLAKHRRMDRDVAIKVLPVTALESESAVARFYQEVKVAAQLTHPNIVHAYDAGEHRGFHYLVMEYVPGHDLARVLQHMGPIPEPLAIDYIQQACHGLHYAHRKGVTHRDIKPSNLLLDDEGTIKILDMGLARIGRNALGAPNDGNASVHLTTTGQVMGTVEYMSPEQAEDTRAADGRSDIYSLGCTLYRLITGVGPFSRDTVVKTILAHREADIPDLPGSINNVFKKMVAKKPDERYQSVGELIEALRSLDSDPTINISSSSIPGLSNPPQVVGLAENQVDPDGSTPADWRNQTVEPIVEPIVQRGAAVPPDAIYPQQRHGYAAQFSANVPNQPGQNPESNTANYVRPSLPLDDEDVHIPEIVSPSPISYPGIPRLKPHAGRKLAFFGILSIVASFICVGFLPATIIWLVASSHLGQMDQGERDPTGRPKTERAIWYCKIAIVINILWVIGSIVRTSIDW